MSESSSVIPDRILARELLRYAVQRRIFSPYGGEVLDVRRAVLIDGTDHGGRMDIMTAAEHDKVLAAIAPRTLADLFGHQVDVYDGRILFGKAKKPANDSGQS